MLYVFFFFFFQAEDGIRDYKVTGVQTCALPICRPQAAGRRAAGPAAPRPAPARRFGSPRTPYGAVLPRSGPPNLRNAGGKRKGPVEPGPCASTIRDR